MLRLLLFCALLALTTADKFYTEVSKGDSKGNLTDPAAKYYIKDGQCSGYLHGDKISCEFWDGPPSFLKVRLEDAYTDIKSNIYSKVNIEYSLASVSIYRISPCAGDALVSVWKECEYDAPPEPDSSRRDNAAAALPELPPA